MTELRHRISLEENGFGAVVHCDPDQLHLICFRYSIVLTLNDNGDIVLTVKDNDMKDESKEVLFTHNSSQFGDRYGDD